MRGDPDAADTPDSRPHVVVLGGGFAGLNCVRELEGSGTRITLVDRRNFHLFQPLLYQVATSMLSPADISATLRGVFRSRDDVRMLQGEATDLDPDSRTVTVGERDLKYDYLVVATGFQALYPPDTNWREHALELKSLEDALEIRSRFLDNLERAEWEDDERERQRLLTAVLIGGGPTGVELAGALVEAAQRIIPREFCRLDLDDLRVILLEMESEVLPGFPERSRKDARKLLEECGVEVHTDTAAAAVEEGSVSTESGDSFDAALIVWCAAVGATGLAARLPGEQGPQGRLRVKRDCSLPDHPELFVIGDLAYIEQDGEAVPAMAPAAIQMGRHVARAIRCDLEARARPDFEYNDKGLLATVGYSSAVASIRGWHFSGFFAWILWGLVHIAYLVGFRDRLAVLWQWLWAWLTRSREVRLITHGRRRSNPPAENTSDTRD